MSPLHIAALGSSFASGPGIPPEDSPTARRSKYNYPSLVARSLDARLTDLSSSGATLLNVLNEPQAYATGEVAKPQLDALSKVQGAKGIDIVMITAGGNDVGYSKGMIGDAAKVVFKDDEDFLDVFMEMLGPSPGTDSAQATFKHVEDRFVQVIDRVHALAPRASILLVEYISIFNAETKTASDQPLDSEHVLYYRHMAQQLSDAYQRAATMRKDFVEVLEMGTVSEGHALGSEEPWVTGFTEAMIKGGGVPFHPSAAGHIGVAEAVGERVRGIVEGGSR